jgi:hypothetical protein
MTSAAPGSARALCLIVSDVATAGGELAGRYADVSGAFHAGTPGAQFQPDGTSGRVSGAAPDDASYGSFATLSGRDGNGWLLQEVTTRPSRRAGAAQTAVAAAAEMAGAMHRAPAAHGERENRIGAADPDWPGWRAAYMVAEQAGTELAR